MQVTLQSTGETVQVGLGAAVPQRMGSIPASTLYVNTISGVTPIEGELASGSSAASPIQGQSTGAFIGFYSGASLIFLVNKFKMDDAAAVTTGLATIAAALNASTEAITLKTDGTLGS